MPTKFPRKRCTCCNRRYVAWKMPTMFDPVKSRRVFFCWQCSAAFFEKLLQIDILQPPDKKKLLAYAKKLHDEAKAIRLKTLNKQYE